MSISFSLKRTNIGYDMAIGLDEDVEIEFMGNTGIAVVQAGCRFFRLHRKDIARLLHLLAGLEDARFCRQEIGMRKLTWQAHGRRIEKSFSPLYHDIMEENTEEASS